jgi:hypothetical protein
MAKLVRFERMKFFSTPDEALAYLRKAIAEDDSKPQPATPDKPDVESAA